MEEYLESETLPDLTNEEEDEIDQAGSQVHHRLVVRLNLLLFSPEIAHTTRQCTWIDSEKQ